MWWETQCPGNSKAKCAKVESVEYRNKSGTQSAIIQTFVAICWAIRQNTVSFKVMFKLLNYAREIRSFAFALPVKEKGPGLFHRFLWRLFPFLCSLFRSLSLSLSLFLSFACLFFFSFFLKTLHFFLKKKRKKKIKNKEERKMTKEKENEFWSD